MISEPIGGLAAFLCGMIGGLAPEFYSLYKIRHTLHKKRPDWLGSLFFWGLTGGMIFLGGLVAYIYVASGAKLTYWMAVHIGMTTPILLNQALNKPPTVR